MRVSLCTTRSLHRLAEFFLFSLRFGAARTERRRPDVCSSGLLDGSNDGLRVAAHFWVVPKRRQAEAADDLLYWYDRINAEKAVSAAGSEWTILRLSKVCGAEGNADLGPSLAVRPPRLARWAHGCVANVAAAIGLATRHPEAANALFNIGEEETPTMDERLGAPPPRPDFPPGSIDARFEHHLRVDTSEIRTRLGFKDVTNSETPCASSPLRSTNDDAVRPLGPADIWLACREAVRRLKTPSVNINQYSRRSDRLAIA